MELWKPEMDVTRMSDVDRFRSKIERLDTSKHLLGRPVDWKPEMDVTRMNDVDRFRSRIERLDTSPTLFDRNGPQPWRP